MQGFLSHEAGSPVLTFYHTKNLRGPPKYVWRPTGQGQYGKYAAAQAAPYGSAGPYPGWNSKGFAMSLKKPLTLDIASAVAAMR